MFHAIVYAAIRLRGAPFTAISLVAITVVGLLLLQGRTSVASANTRELTPQLPRCVVGDGAFTIPAQLHIPIGAEELAERSGIPGNIVVTNTLGLTEVVTDAIVIATAAHDYERLDKTDELLLYPLTETSSITNTWTIHVDGPAPASDVDADFLRDISTTLLFGLLEYGTIKTSEREFGGLPLTGLGSMIVTNTSVEEFLVDNYNLILPSAAGGELPDYSVYLTYTVASQANIVEEDTGLITSSPQLFVAENPIVLAILRVGDNWLGPIEFTLPKEFAAHTNELLNSIGAVDAGLQRVHLSDLCQYANSTIVTEGLDTLGANPVALASGVVNDVVTVSLPYTVINRDAGGSMVYFPVILTDTQASMVIRDPLDGIITQTINPLVPQPITITNAISGTWTFQIVQEQGTTPYGVAVGTAPPPSVVAENCDDLLISNYATTPSESQYVDIVNVGETPAAVDGCSFAAFDALTELSIGNATVGLEGTLASGEIFRVGSAGLSDVDAIISNGAIRGGPGALVVLDAPPPPDGTPVSSVLPDDVTGMVYLDSENVFGVSHLRNPGHNSIYECIYGGSGAGPFSGPFPVNEDCLQ